MGRIKRKSSVALLQKRKKFSGVFLKRLLVALVASVLVYVLGLTAFVEYRKAMVEEIYDSRSQVLVNSVSASTENNEFWKNELMCSMLMRQEMGATSLLYDSETREIIAGCEEHIVMIKRKTEKEPRQVYMYPTKNIEGWDETREKMKKYKDSHCTVLESIDISNVYINGTNFIPEELTVTYELYDDKKKSKKELATHTFKSSQEIPVGYEKCELDKTWMGPLVIGYNESELGYWEGYRASYDILQQVYREEIQANDMLDTFFSITLIDETKLRLDNGRQVTMITVAVYDSIEEYGNKFILAGVITLVVGILGAFIWARLAYAKMKAQYDMDDYRKMLMNTMAHDLKSPLMSISGYAENLKNSINTEKQDYYSEAILGNVQYMNGIIESVLTLGKTENPNIKLKKVITEIKPLIKECTKKYDLKIKEKQLKVDIEGNTSLEIDVALFKQAIDNLIVNAIKYSAKGSSIKVKMSEKSLVITNTCEDKLETEVEKLYQPFVVGNENRSDQKGSGLGLAITNNICELHKFSFTIKYEGNMFIVEIRK